MGSPNVKLCESAGIVSAEVQAAVRERAVLSGGLRASRPADERWADLPEGLWCLSIVAATDAETRHEHWLDLSVGSDERRLAAAIVRQGSLRFRWPQAGLEHTHEVTAEMRAKWNEALAASEGLDAAAWERCVAEVRWSQSPSWRPGRPVPSTEPARRPARRRPHVPYLASEVLAVPEDGSPTVADVELPVGHRAPDFQPVYWVTDAPLADAAAVSGRLVRAFPSTGLWPVLWEWEEDPSDYLGGHAERRTVPQLDAESVFRAAWDGAGATPEAGRAFPGLAEGSYSPAVEMGDPFLGDAAPQGRPAAPPRLLLVPCSRPSEALAVLDWDYSQIPAALTAAMLASWEERFAAVLVRLEPSALTLHVGAPPTTTDQGLRLAAELMAAAEGGSDPATQQGLAKLLVTGRYVAGFAAHQGTFQPDRWRFAFREDCPPALAALNEA